MTSKDVGRLLVRCPDQLGIVAAISTFLFDAGANIISSDQYSDNPEGGTFFLRTEFHLTDLEYRRSGLERDFAEHVARALQMEWKISYSWVRKRVALLASRHDHCLLDLLWRWRRGELDNADVVAVVSNHPDHEADVSGFGASYYHIPVTSYDKSPAEARMLDLLTGNVDLVVLARYMQILTGDFLARINTPVINIHHSFLPAFIGAKPYEQAHERGVKVIGATAHYVTEALDAGPIIDQDVARVTHRDEAEDLERIGRDIERSVLARAVTYHLQDRVIVHENRTVVF